MAEVGTVRTDSEVSRDVLAAILGVDVRSLKNFVDEGMPKAARGRYPLGDCVRWYIGREREAARASRGLNELDRARRRKTEAEAREAELRVQRALAQVVPVEVLEQTVGRVCDRLMPILQNLSANYGLRLEQMGIDAARAESMLDAIATELTKALQSTAGELEHEAAAVDDEETDDRTSGAA